MLVYITLSLEIKRILFYVYGFCFAEFLLTFAYTNPYMALILNPRHKDLEFSGLLPFCTCKVFI
jgi:hypothetical protein